jgi:SAM-dependent methyltransferase
VSGLEISVALVEDANARRHEEADRLRFGVADITDAATLGEFEGPYDLILYRDVLEHIPDRDAALKNSLARLAPGGALVVIFPPWWSAYGGHQQTLGAARRIALRWAKLPFMHWLGDAGHRALAGIAASDPEWRELQTIRSAHLSLRGMKKTAASLGLRLAHERNYLSRPTYRLRYGLPIVPAGLLGRIALLREVIVMGSYQCYVRDDARVM